MRTRTVARISNPAASWLPGSTSIGPRTRTILRTALALIALVGPVPGFAAPTAHARDEVLVRFRSGSNRMRRNALNAAAGGTTVKQFATVADLELVKLYPKMYIAKLLEQYGKQLGVV